MKKGINASLNPIIVPRGIFCVLLFEFLSSKNAVTIFTMMNIIDSKKKTMSRYLLTGNGGFVVFMKSKSGDRIYRTNA